MTAAPSTITAGDLLLAYIESGAAVSAVPAGWVQVSNAGPSLYAKVASASEPASYTWGLPVATPATGVILDYTVGAPTAPVASTNGSAATLQAASVFTFPPIATPGAVVLEAWGTELAAGIAMTLHTNVNGATVVATVNFAGASLFIVQFSTTASGQTTGDTANTPNGFSTHELTTALL